MPNPLETNHPRIEAIRLDNVEKRGFGTAARSCILRHTIERGIK